MINFKGRNNLYLEYIIYSEIIISPSKSKLTPSLAIPHQLSDHFTVGTQPNDQMIVNDLNFPKLSVIPHDVKPVGTQPHNNNYLTDENSLNHNHPKSRQQRRILCYMKQTAGQLGLYNPNFSILTLDKKINENASWLKLSPHKLLPRPYVLINRHNKPYFSILMYQIHPFSSPTPVFHKLQKLIITLNTLANNHQNMTTDSDILDGIMKEIGFFQGSDSGKSAGVYARKVGLTKKQLMKIMSNGQHFKNLMNSFTPKFQDLQIIHLKTIKKS
ncbi:hypothetical protein O181_067214 [Austropuccinia psidii MF-1]|uniref:Uncharacterized protein n=1 Tax=Austropuccinia psidii MF-1 TaxID=1389203 RepID=A0A9Q3I6A7_9BASI|nr:hypothetical protein [Austropuccinia psidii MF-1]